MNPSSSIKEVGIGTSRQAPGQSRPAQPPTARVNEVSLFLENQCRSVDQPITVGLPFPEGVLSNDTSLQLSSKQGTIPLQTETLARWSDGSAKWVLLDFLAPTQEAGTTTLTLGLDAEPSVFRSPFQIQETAQGVVVDTGVARYHLNRTRLGFAEIMLGDRQLLGSEPGGLQLRDERGKPVRLSIENLVVETRGPVRGTVRFEGKFTGGVKLRVVMRLSFFAGTALARMSVTLHNPRRARHRGGLWDLGDPNSVLFNDLSYELGLHSSGPTSVRWVPEIGQEEQSTEQRFELYQDSSGGENWRSRNHVNRAGTIPLAFRGYRIRNGKTESFGQRATPLVAWGSEAGQVSIALPEFWQQFPKGLEVHDSTLRVGLFPRQSRDLFELQGGEQKTTTVWFDFSTGRSSLDRLHWVHQPTCVHASGDWYRASGAIPYLGPRTEPASQRLDSFLDEALAGPKNLFARREVIDQYGWRNFGEFHADHEEAYYSGPKPSITHYNNQYDVVYGCLLQYLRTGDPRWVELYDPLARHVIDIDIYHTQEDKAAYNGGLFWFTDHYKDAGTSTHRTYSRLNAPPDRSPYGGGPGNCHNFTSGLALYYFLTGDPNAKDAVRSLADWVVRMDDGGENVLGVLDDGPTGSASWTTEPDYHGPGRGPGLSINALIDGWFVLGERRYLEKVEELIRRTVHPDDDVDSRDLLDIERRWSYTIYLTALDRYLRAKAEAGEVDFMYAYAQASLLRYAEWMLEHERPYFDQRENLEYPTETWAAQELRKANVLRLAAAYADPALAHRLKRRGEELADRAWRDLFGFDTRHVVRAVAIVMSEGTRDSFFRSESVPPAPPLPTVSDFGPPPPAFIPQKQRVLARLKSPRGLAGAMLLLAYPPTWRKLLARWFG